MSKEKNPIIFLKYKCMVYLILHSVLNHLIAELINSSKISITRRLMSGRILRILVYNLVDLDVFYELLRLIWSFNSLFTRVLLQNPLLLQALLLHHYINNWKKIKKKIKRKAKDFNFLLTNTFTKILRNNGGQNTIKIRNFKLEV